jgi:hypothetical protein
MTKLILKNQIVIDFRKWSIKAVYTDGYTYFRTNFTTKEMEILHAHFLKDKKVKTIQVLEIKNN